MATKDEKELLPLGYKLKSQSASPVNESTDPSTQCSGAAKSLELPCSSYLEYEQLPKEVVDNVLETNLCCLKALLHYSGFELLAESPDLEIQCKLCKMKLETDDNEYDLERPKNRMLCKNTNHRSLETIVFNHLKASRNKAQKESEFSSELSTTQMPECERAEALENYETNIFTHKAALVLIFKLLKTRSQLQAELQEKTSKLEEKELVIKEQDSELKRQGETLVEMRTEYTNLEMAAIPRWNKFIQERESYKVTIQKLKAIAEERRQEILHQRDEIQWLKEKNSDLDEKYKDSTKLADLLQDSFTREQEKCAGLERKNQTLEELLKKNDSVEEGFQRIHISQEGNEQASVQEVQVNVNQNSCPATPRKKKRNKNKSQVPNATKGPDKTPQPS